MKKIVLILFFMLNWFGAKAGENAGSAGSYLRMGLGARSLAMGNTGIASGVNAYSAFYNPALFGLIEGKLVGLSYSFMSLDRRFNYISFSMQVPPGAGFSVGWIESGVGDIKSYDIIGNETGEINHSANAVYFSFGRKFSEKLAIGLSLKILFEYINDGTEQLDYTGKGVGIDLGVLYQLRDDLNLAYQLRDLKSQLKAQTDKIFDRGGTTIFPFPVINKLGLFYKSPLSWLRAAYEFEWSNRSEMKHHIGFEAIQGKNLALRIGYNGIVMTFGAGMDFTILGVDSFLDYAFLPSVIDEGSNHVFSWQVAF